MLEKKPKDRITIANIKSHSFFRTIDWHKMEKKRLKPPIHLSLDDEDSTKASGMAVEDVEEQAFLNFGPDIE